MKTLVIGYGNELRSDDGAGPRLAREVAAWGCPDVEVIVAHQLTPELAADMSAVDRVVFVDASSDPDLVVARWGEIKPGEAGSVGSHMGNPTALLGLSQLLYGRAPQGVLLEIPGENFELGETLSARTIEGLQEALELIRRLIKPAAPASAPTESEP